MFLSTRRYHYNYNFIVKSAKQNCENILHKKLDILFFKKKKNPSLRYLIFFIYIILSGKIFKADRAKIEYENIEIGRFVLSQTFCDYECYVNKYKFYIVLLKNFFHSGTLLNTCKYYNDKFNIDGVYVDHCGYLNGIIFTFFALNKSIVYTNNYPLGIYCVNYKKNKKNYLSKYENTLRISIKRQLNKIQEKNSKQKLTNLVKKKDFIPYLVKANYKKLDIHNYKIFDYIVYCHSFTDGQLWHGYADFENNLEWLEFTINALLKRNKKILIKPHPNFYNGSLGQSAKWDKIIYDKLVKRFSNNSNLFFLSKPTQNYPLLKKLNKNCVLLSKYGTAILEGAYMNFKTICTCHNFFDKKFRISNMWKDKTEYLRLLKTDVSHLKKPNRNDLIKLSYALFYYYNSEYHENFYDNIIRKSLKLNKDNYQKQFSTIGRKPIGNSKLNKFKHSTKFIEKNIINKISRTIFEVTK